MKQLSTRAEMQYNIHTLSNGLRIIHEPSLSKVAYCGFAVDAAPVMRLKTNKEWPTLWST